MMQPPFEIPSTQQYPLQEATAIGPDRSPTIQSGTTTGIDESGRAAERARLRQGTMHVRIEHFYCTLEEIFDPTLQGNSFVVGTGTGRPNEPGRVIDASPAALRLGITPGMPLRRAHRIAPRTRFLSASYDRYQPILQKLKERYRYYSRIVESIPISDAFIDLRGCELPFASPVVLAERLCAEISEMGLKAMIGIANGKAISELAALMSRKDGRKGVLYIPPGREASFVQTLPLALLNKIRASSTGMPTALPDFSEDDEPASQTGSRASRASRAPVSRNSQSSITTQDKKTEQIDPIAISEMVNHLGDFGVTTFVQVAALKEEALIRRLGPLGGWLHHIANGEDNSLVIPDAPPLSQNARVRFHHQADADEACAALRKLSDYLAERLREQRLKGQSIALILWPAHLRRDPAGMGFTGEENAITTSEETLGGQMVLSRHTDEPDIIAHHSLMLFAHYHRPGMRYLQVQLRIGDIITTIPTYVPPPPARTRRLTRRLTRKL